jgi:hypothetical protein
MLMPHINQCFAFPVNFYSDGKRFLPSDFYPSEFITMSIVSERLRNATMFKRTFQLEENFSQMIAFPSHTETINIVISSENELNNYLLLPSQFVAWFVDQNFRRCKFLAFKALLLAWVSETYFMRCENVFIQHS